MSRILTILAVLAICGSLYATDVSWDAGGADDNWLTPENWVGDAVPANGDRVFLDVADASILIDAGDSVAPRKVIGPCENAAGTVTLTVKGELTNTSYWYMGRENGGEGILNVDGGTIHTRDLIVAPGTGYVGTINIIDGLLDINGSVAGTGAYFSSDPGAGVTSGTATVNVMGGTLQIALLNELGTNAVINITDGEMILAGDQVSVVQAYEQAGQIVGDSGSKDLIISTFVSGEDTYTRVIPEPATIGLLAAGFVGLIRRKR